MPPKFTIGTLAGLSGLSAHTIRAWERRYQALSPGRTETNRRLYDQADLERLLLLKRAVGSGHTIGLIAHLPVEELSRLEVGPVEAGTLEAGAVKARTVEVRTVAVGALESPTLESGILAPTTSAQPEASGADHFREACLQAMEALDPEALDKALVRGGAVLGIDPLLDDVVLPLLSRIDAGWLSGAIGIAQEHMASAVLRVYLDRIRLSMPAPAGAPMLLVTTPRHQLHEIGALIVALVATLQAWNVVYLGPNLPAQEISRAARTRGVQALALSIVYPIDDPTLPQELLDLRHGLGPMIPILVGGRGAQAVAYAMSLREIGAHVVQTLPEFRARLCRLLD